MRLSPTSGPGDQGSECQVGEKELVLDIETFCYGKHQMCTKVKRTMQGMPVSLSPSFTIISPWPLWFYGNLSPPPGKWIITNQIPDITLLHP